MKNEMKISKNGIKLLIELEGFTNKIYRCSAGHETIGVGHKLTQRDILTNSVTIYGNMINIENGLSTENVYNLLYQDLKFPEDQINKFVFVNLTQNQYDALVIFVFNVGVESFKNSTLLVMLNQGKYENIPDQIMRWDKITKNGVKIVSKGLVNRRKKECELWNLK